VSPANAQRTFNASWIAILALLVSSATRAAERGEAVAVDDEAPSGREWSALNERLSEVIAAEESRNGPFSAELIDLFARLGLVHQEYGLHTRAAEALERALQVARVNEGLHTLDQEPLVRQLMASKVAIGDYPAASELQGRLLELAYRNLGDTRAIPILREAGDRNVEAFERYLAGEAPPSQVSINAPPPSMVYGSALRQARNHYWTAINAIYRAQRYSHEDLVGLEQGLTRSFYLEATNRPYGREHADWLYGVGKESYQRRAVYSALNEGTTVDYPRTLVELGDWALLFSHNGGGVEYYDEAYALLVERSAPTLEIEELFPNQAVRLPTFMPNPLQTTPSDESRGYADVEFELSKYGRPRDVRVVYVSDQSLQDAGKDVARTVAASRFRPKPTSLRGAGMRYASRYYID
jgi:hypothetical protein